ncbi:MAG TPA: sulfite exporter TauE/SafE family protein [Actinomycetota bacterium]|nr:sulfite exporter TauE/SafE family protein [Actinomycetota bacterium]
MGSAEPRSPGRLAAAAVVGILAGVLSGLFGVGGGILIVPGLVLVMGMEQRLAHGTSLAAIVPIAVSGVAGYALERAVDWPAAALLALGAAGGAVLGTYALRRMSQRVLRLLFGLFLLLAAAQMLIQIHQATGRGELDIGSSLILVLVGVTSGSLAGLLGVGGGIVIVPALVILLSVPDALAKGTSLAVIIPTAVVGTLRNLRHRGADLPVAVLVGLFGIAAAFGASKVSVRMEPRLSSFLFAGLLVLVAARLLVGAAVGSGGRTAGTPGAPGNAEPTVR